MPSPLLVAASISAALALGMVSVLFRSLQVPLQQRVVLSQNLLGRLDKLLFLSWVPLMPVAGGLVDHWGLHEVLFTGSLGLALAVSWIALAKNFASLVWGVLGLGIAGAFVTTAGVTLMPSALTLVANWSVGASLCLGFVFVGLAAFLAPRLIPGLARRFGFRQTVLCLGLFCLLPATLVALVKADIPTPAEAPLLEASLYDVRFWLIALVSFLYFPLERSLEIWPRAYLTEIGYDGRATFRLVVGFWCAFLLLRFGLGWMIRAGNEAWLVVTLLIVSSMIMGNLAGAYAPSSGYVGFWLVGACYGPLWPALLGILAPAGTHSIPGRAVGVLFGLSALSSLLVQPLCASFANRHLPRVSMRILMLLGLVMAAPMLVLALIR